MRGGPAQPIGDSVTGALKALGVPSKALSRRVFDAWDSVSEPAWRGLALPSRLVGGILVVAVESASLRQDLAQFHAERLLVALRSTLPDESILAIRFEAGRVRGA